MHSMHSMHSMYSMYKETKFEYVIRICVLNELPKYVTTTTYTIDLFELSKCNKNLNNLLVKKLLEHNDYPLSIMLKWNEHKQRKYKTDVKRVSANDIDIDICENFVSGVF